MTEDAVSDLAKDQVKQLMEDAVAAELWLTERHGVQGAAIVAGAALGLLIAKLVPREQMGDIMLGAHLNISTMAKIAYNAQKEV